MLRAILRACAFCEDASNYGALSEILARPEYLSISQEAILRSLALDQTVIQRSSTIATRPAGSRVRSFAPEQTFPSKTHFAWLVMQMIRWRHLCSTTDALQVAEWCAETSVYREVASSLGIGCPADDFPAMPLRNGEMFNVTQAAPMETADQKILERV